MAKSLKSKIKQKFKAVRRKEIYKPVEDARLERLASKQKIEPGVSRTLNDPDQVEAMEVEESTNAADSKPEAKQTFEKKLAKKKIEKSLGNVNSATDKHDSKTKGKKKNLTAKQKLRW